MQITKNSNWDCYETNNYQGFDEDKVGKWMHFFSRKDLEIISAICKSAIDKNIVNYCKHNNDYGCKYNLFTNGNSGVACFYLHFDDIDTHKKVIDFFLENNLIRKTKNGKFYNISFKLDNQTKSKQYGDEFYSPIKLSNFIDLESGTWIYDK